MAASSISIPSVSVIKLEPNLHNISNKSLNPPPSKEHQRIAIIPRNQILPPMAIFQQEQAFYMPLLQECIDNKSVPSTKILHAHMIKTGIHQDYFLMTFLLNVYAKCGAMLEALRVFDKLSTKNVVAWTSLMTGYVRNSDPQTCIRFFTQMLQSGAQPTNYTFGVVLNASTSLRNIQLGRQFHAYTIKYQLHHDTSVGNSLITFYSTSNFLKSSIKAFNNIKHKNVISWTALISACSLNGDATTGLRFFSQMLSYDVTPNEFTITTVLSLCAAMLCLDIGAQIHSLSIKLGFQTNLRVTNSVMYMYLKSGCTTQAQILFDRMDSISLITWNAMIAGFSKMMDFSSDYVIIHSKGKQALQIFSKLNKSGMKPDLFTYSSVLTVCSKLFIVEQGEQIHAQTIKTGFLSDMVVGTSLINMYGRCGSIDKASKAFLEMSTRTLISWTAMITNLAQHGKSIQALEFFDDMILAGVKPNQITFVAILAACSHAGFVDKALNFFQIMQEGYKIKPVLDHYACLIDMYVRLGRIEEAFDLVKRSDFEPSEFIWIMLIIGSKTHDKKELGFFAAEELLKLKPKDAETYVLLLNMYIDAEKWQEVSRIRKLMKEEKIGKLKDWSWINIRDEILWFKTNDNSHPLRAEVYIILKELIKKAKRFGYNQPNSFAEIEEIDEVEGEGKAPSSSVYHSEKLAVAYGLLSTSFASPIRVVKSVSMCRDCHDFMEVVSLLTSREVIVRDKKRLHKFVNGHCSCGDVVSPV